MIDCEAKEVKAIALQIPAKMDCAKSFSIVCSQSCAKIGPGGNELG
jgi:hypothetical protein